MFALRNARRFSRDRTRERETRSRRKASFSSFWRDGASKAAEFRKWKRDWLFSCLRVVELADAGSEAGPGGVDGEVGAI